MMRVAIIALVLSGCALGLAAFSTVRSFDGEDAPAAPIAEATSGWSESECGWAKQDSFMQALYRACRSDGNCGALSDMIQAINDNCP